MGGFCLSVDVAFLMHGNVITKDVYIRRRYRFKLLWFIDWKWSNLCLLFIQDIEERSFGFHLVFYLYIPDFYSIIWISIMFMPTCDSPDEVLGPMLEDQDQWQHEQWCLHPVQLFSWSTSSTNLCISSLPHVHTNLCSLFLDGCW